MPEVKGTVSVNAYAVVQRAVEDGIAYGWARAWKHADAQPGMAEANYARDQIEQAVMNALCEVLTFPGDG